MPVFKCPKMALRMTKKQKRRPLFNASIPPKWWIACLFYASTTLEKNHPAEAPGGHWGDLPLFLPDEVFPSPILNLLVRTFFVINFEGLN